MAAEVQRPEAPILGVEERKDVKAFYTNAAYRTSRAAINVEKMKVNARAQGLMCSARV